MSGTEHLVAFLDSALKVEKTGEISTAIDVLVAALGDRLQFVPVGSRENNKGIIEVGNDPGRCLIERVTNASDAVLDYEYLRHKGVPTCTSPRDASHAWLDVPTQGLSALSPTKRRELARRVVITLESGDGKELRTVSIRDDGIGLTRDEVPKTILSLNESNKISKRHLAGTYGQGGSSTFAVSETTLIVSQKREADHLCFTIVKYFDRPAETYKTGHYLYAVVDGQIPAVPATTIEFQPGTLVRHFGFDLSHYGGAFDPGSVYGLLNRYLFDPVMPVILQNKVYGWNRTIKGSRNSLNGAVDEGDDAKVVIAHSMPLYSVSMGDLGSIGIEYWLLGVPDSKNKNPIRAYVDHNKPFILTNNGQNQGEISSRLLKKEIEFSYLAGRLICHVNCDNLTPDAKRRLLTSTREQMRTGFVYDAIVKQIVQSLSSDEDLKKANDEAREASLKNRDETHEKEIRTEVSRLLKLHGIAIGDTTGGGDKSEKGPKKPRVPRPPPVPPKPIPMEEPPTFIEIAADANEPLRFYPEQRRYLRIRTNANSTYHNATDLSKSRINFIVGNDLKLAGTTPLNNGRMRIILDCSPESQIGSSGEIRLELSRTGLPVLSAIHGYEIVAPPKAEEKSQTSNVPEFEIIGVDGPDDSNWGLFPEEIPDDEIASYAQMDGGKLLIYYSRIYPKFMNEMKALEAKDANLAKTFQKRYEIWLIVHSLMFYQDQKLAEDKGEALEIEDSVAVRIEHRERGRIAVVAALMAKKEAQAAAVATDLED